MKTSTVILLSIFLVLTLTTLAVAQSGGVPILPDPPDQTPIGGLEILAALGGLYAVKKLRDKE